MKLALLLLGCVQLLLELAGRLYFFLLFGLGVTDIALLLAKGVVLPLDLLSLPLIRDAVALSSSSCSLSCSTHITLHQRVLLLGDHAAIVPVGPVAYACFDLFQTESTRFRLCLSEVLQQHASPIVLSARDDAFARSQL